VSNLEQQQGEILPKRFKFAKGAVKLFLLGSFLILAYIYYRSELVSNGAMRHIYFKYYLASIVGILFWVSILYVKDLIKLNIVMATISLIVGLYFVEVFLNFKAHPYSPPNEKKVELAKASGLDFDTRTILQVYTDLKDLGVDVVTSISPSEFIPTNGFSGPEPLIPLGGVSRKTTILCNEGGKYSIYPSDRYGFNNPDSTWEDQRRIKWLLVGDSFTQGSCVNPGAEISGQIRIKTNSSVINLGIKGNGPLCQLAGLKEYAEFKKPKTVLWLYFEGNDLSENLPREKTSSILMSYLQPKFSQNLINRQVEIDERELQYFFKEKERKEKLGQEKLINLDKTFWMTRILRFHNLRKQIAFDNVLDIDPLFSEILTKARDRTEEWGGILYFVYLPQFLRYATLWQNHDSFRKRSEVIEVVKGLNIPTIDIHREVFENHPDPLALFPLRSYGHYNAEGYKKVAEGILKAIEKSQDN
jgi:hypothetical protein